MAAVKVLIVDDEPDNARTLSTLFRAHGYDADFCTEPWDCLAKIEKMRPEVVILDIQMPKVHGLRIAEELREHPDLRPKLLIAVTGYGMEADRQQTAEAGFDAHFLKPVRWSDLQKAIHDCIK